MKKKSICTTKGTKHTKGRNISFPNFVSFVPLW
jgi:hypothetical protein